MALPANLLTCEVYDKAFNRTGFVSDFVSYDVHFRWGQQGGGTFTVDADHPYINALTAQGARVILRYRNQVMSGVLLNRSGSSGPPPTITLEVVDDWRLGSRILGWPNPTGAINQQGLDAAQDKRTGPAEDVFKWYVRRNAVTRLGLPVTVAADGGRGATIAAAFRMHLLWDQLVPLMLEAGVGPTVRQSGAGLLVDVYPSAYFGHEVNPDSGVVESYEWEQKGPTVTRVVVGGEGEGKNRDFRLTVDTAREAAWGDVIEQFIDARDAYSDVRSALDDQASKLDDYKEKQRDYKRAQVDQRHASRAQVNAQRHYDLANDWAASRPTDTAAQARKTDAQQALTDANTQLTQANTDLTAALNAQTAAQTAYNTATTTVATERGKYDVDLANRASEALAGGAPTTTLRMTLTDNDMLVFGSTVMVGDTFSVRLVPGAPAVVVTIVEANATLSEEDGPQMRLIVGEKADDPTRGLWAAVATLARAIRRDRAGR